jgi:uncharacterized membrane protein
MRRWWFGPLVIAAMALFGLAVLPGLPPRVPIHWNFQGEVDAWATPGWSIAFFPAVALGLWAVLCVLRRFDPRRNPAGRGEQLFYLVLNLTLLILAAGEVLTLGSTLGWPIDMPRVGLVVLGAAFIAMGSYLPRAKPMGMVGFRTPWTLASERVWHETHRLASRTFLAGGVVTLAAALAPAEYQPWVASIGLVVAGFVPVGFSYVAWRREQLAASRAR